MIPIYNLHFLSSVLVFQRGGLKNILGIMLWKLDPCVCIDRCFTLTCQPIVPFQSYYDGENNLMMLLIFSFFLHLIMSNLPSPNLHHPDQSLHYVPFMRQTIIHIFPLSIIFMVSISRTDCSLPDDFWLNLSNLELFEGTLCIGPLMADRPLTLSNKLCSSLVFNSIAGGPAPWLKNHMCAMGPIQLFTIYINHSNHVV